MYYHKYGVKLLLQRYSRCKTFVPQKLREVLGSSNLPDVKKWLKSNERGKKINQVTGQGYPHALHIPENTDKARNCSRSKKNATLNVKHQSH